MHAISYQLKRGHLSAVALGRKIFRGTKEPTDPDYDGVPDMTPARFDILYLVFGRKMRTWRAPHRIEMSELRKTLGLARATISKAIKRLVELGLVTVGFPLAGGNRRNKIVTLTDEGVARITRAMHLVFTGRALSRHYRRLVAKKYDRRVKPRHFPSVIDHELYAIADGFEEMARHLFDRSNRLYPIRVFDPHVLPFRAAPTATPRPPPPPPPPPTPS